MSPLIERDLDAPIAWLSAPLPYLACDSGIVNCVDFINQVNYLAQCLPSAGHAINLCDNRYSFLLSMCAVIVRQQINLLPSNKNPATVLRLSERYADCYVLHDACISEDDLRLMKQPQLNVCEQNFKQLPTQVEASIPQVDLGHVAVISFTSGSTGDSKPNIKTWRTLRDSSHINRQYMLPNLETVFYHLATVPGQHMWGLETSVLMALFANVCIADSRPLYPHDILTELARLPKPRNLISTPLHLRALNGVKQTMPEAASILSATAPLNKELAKTIETQFKTKVIEIYGCSEVGSMAVRQTAKDSAWQIFEGLDFIENSGSVTVHAAHLPAPVLLEDMLEMHGLKSFSLLGRSSDQINIAGKRGSLQEVNKVLFSFDGLRDGVVFFSPQDRTVERLVALVVMDSAYDKTALRAHFRRYLDAAFVPRPIMLVSSLPREENGKLIKSRLLGFYQDELAKSR